MARMKLCYFFAALLAICAPTWSFAQRISLHHLAGSLKPTLAPVSEDENRSAVCDDGLVLRTIKFSDLTAYGSFASVFKRAVSKARVVRRGAEAPPTLTHDRFNSHFKQSSNPSAPTNAGLNVSMELSLSLCEAFGFIEFVSGSVKVGGNVGYYRIDELIDLNDLAKNEVSLTWVSPHWWDSKATAAGELSLKILNIPVDVTHSEHGSQLSAVLDIKVTQGVIFDEGAS